METIIHKLWLGWCIFVLLDKKISYIFILFYLLDNNIDG